MRPTDRRHSERGTATVEFALLLPVMVVLALIVSEGASVIRTHQVLNNAAREGARVASIPESRIVDGASNAAVITAVKNAAVTYAGNNGVTITPANVTVNQLLMVPTASGVGLTASQVTVSYSYPLTYLPNFGSISASVPMSVSAEFKNFY
jgi:Flp pilus assembly protein TadG